MIRLMDGGKSSFPYKQFMPVSNMGRNKLNDALKAVETGEQEFYSKMSEPCRFSPLHFTLLPNKCNNEILTFV